MGTAMPTILNLGAGSLNPLKKSELINIDEFRGWNIVNLDIYNQVVKYSPDRSTIPHSDADIRYSDVERKIDFSDETIDIVLAVSPYKYSVLNQEVYRVLKRSGVAVILGSQRNRYVTKIESLCSADIKPHFFDLFEIMPANDLALKCIQFVAERGSRNTSGENSTKLDFFGIYRKK